MANLSTAIVVESPRLLATVSMTQMPPGPADLYLPSSWSSPQSLIRSWATDLFRRTVNLQDRVFAPGTTSFARMVVAVRPSLYNDESKE